MVRFVCRATFLENFCNICIFQNIRKITTFYTIVENICGCLKVNMIMIFTRMSLKLLALFFSSFLFVFRISVSLNSRKVIIYLLLKSFTILLVEWFLKCLNKCFRDFFFRAGNVFFNLRVYEVFIQSM